MTWPDVVWRAAILRGLDPRARSEIEAAGALRSFRAGERVYGAGAAADTLFVVIDAGIEVRAHADVVRRATVGESFGEESLVRVGASRPFDAVCVDAGRLAEVPAAIFRRAIGRGGGGGVAARLERTARRAAARDVLARIVGEGSDDLELLLDAAEPRLLARGEVLFRTGEPSDHVFVVADGVLGLRSLEGETGVGEAAPGTVLRGENGRFIMTAVAGGPSWVLAIPHPVAARIAQRTDRPSGVFRRTAFEDPFRLHTARSLLVIDQNACVRCGHCAWACASTHGDGIARFERIGPTWDVRLEDHTVPLLLPNACQHCASPSCLSDCPTGAIVRDGAGDVRIREDLCIGCGACAKACPWENIRIVPRAGAKQKAEASIAVVDRQVAVKCDLCQPLEAGPACVRACPVEAIARVNPGAAHVGPAPARSVRAWPWIAASVPIALAVWARGQAWPMLVTGGMGGALLVALVAYAPLKRLGVRRLRLRIPFLVHLTLGVLTIGVVLAHTRGHLGMGAAGGLHLAFWMATLFGALTGLAGRLLPPRLTHLERGAEEVSEGRPFEAEAFRQLSGRGEGLKALYARLLLPYARATLGPLVLIVSGRGLAEEQRAVSARVEAALSGHRSCGLEGLDRLVRLVVNERARKARRGLRALLGVGLPVHVVATTIVMVLLVVHAALALWRR
jgi:Fe-S-cluster-containing dehydrogenase component/CRP-like cAMP-binding protein